MKPVDQTRFGAPYGNCFPACVATIFELDLEQVPHTCHLDYINGTEQEWWRPFKAWCLDALRVEPITFGAANEWYTELDAPCIISGPAVRGLMHSTVWQHGKMVHDPHPDRSGLIKVTEVMLFIPLRPQFLITPVRRTLMRRLPLPEARQP